MPLPNFPLDTIKPGIEEFTMEYGNIGTLQVLIKQAIDRIEEGTYDDLIKEKLIVKESVLDLLKSADKNLDIPSTTTAEEKKELEKAKAHWSKKYALEALKFFTPESGKPF